MSGSKAFIIIDGNVPAPAHAQIFEQIRALIERGALHPGDAVPPVRQLAGDLGVAPNTVARAYTDLKAAGWLASETRKLTCVADGSTRLARTTRHRALGDAVALFLRSLASRGYGSDEIVNELRRRLPAFDPTSS